MDKFCTVSLFSGAGGFDLGFHLTSRFAVCLANEIKKEPAETLAQNLMMRTTNTSAVLNINKLPAVVQGDVADVDFNQLVQQGLKPHVLIGGPPCQDFSVVKGDLRKGIKVKRGKLYAQFVRALISLQPHMFVFENVPGLISANKGQAFKVLKEDFSNLSIRWPEIKHTAQVDNGVAGRIKLKYEIMFSGIVDAWKLGVPQTRRRLIIVGLRKDLADRLGISKLSQFRDYLACQLSGKSTLTEKYPLTPLEVFEGRPLSELGEKYKHIMLAYEGLWEENQLPHAYIWKEKVWDNLSFDVKKDYLYINKITESRPNEFEDAMKEHKEILRKLGYLNRPVYRLKPEDGSNNLPKEPRAVAERMHRIPPGENHEFVRGTPWHVEGRGLSLIYRRACPLKPAPTVVAYGGGGTWGYHYERNRGKLTNRERARLQTFTDNYMFAGTAGRVRAQIGEAVPPLLAYKIAESLLDILSAADKMRYSAVPFGAVQTAAVSAGSL